MFRILSVRLWLHSYSIPHWKPPCCRPVTFASLLPTASLAVPSEPAALHCAGGHELHEEDPSGCGGLQRAGGRGGLPGEAHHRLRAPLARRPHHRAHRGAGAPQVGPPPHLSPKQTTRSGVESCSDGNIHVWNRLIQSGQKGCYIGALWALTLTFFESHSDYGTKFSRCVRHIWCWEPFKQLGQAMQTTWPINDSLAESIVYLIKICNLIRKALFAVQKCLI